MCNPGGVKLKRERADYGNWVPKRFFIPILIGCVVFVALSVLPIPLALRIVALVIAVGSLLILASMIYLSALFAANDGELQRRFHEDVLDQLPNCWQGRALDIGTGNGALGIRLAQRYPQATVVGLDYWGASWGYSKQMCERNAAIERVDQRITFQRGTASDLPFDDETFDVVVSNYAFHEVRDAKDKREVIREALRVLRQGGWFWLQDVFLDKGIYGDIGDLLDTIRRWGVEEVSFGDASALDFLPPLLRARTPLTLGISGIIYGRK